MKILLVLFTSLLLSSLTSAQDCLTVDVLTTRCMGRTFEVALVAADGPGSAYGLRRLGGREFAYGDLLEFSLPLTNRVGLTLYDQDTPFCELELPDPIGNCNPLQCGGFELVRVDNDACTPSGPYRYRVVSDRYPVDLRYSLGGVYLDSFVVASPSQVVELIGLVSGSTYVVEAGNAAGCTDFEVVNAAEFCGSISGRAWTDENGDGIRQEGEPPFVTEVTVLRPNGLSVQTISTDEQGRYAFSGFDLAVRSQYVLRFDFGLAHDVSPQFAGSSQLDSDIDSTGRTEVLNLSTGPLQTDVDAGFVPGCYFTYTTLPAGCEGRAIEVTLTGAGGVAPYTFTWDDGFVGNVREIASGLVALTVTDAAGCEHYIRTTLQSLDFEGFDFGARTRGVNYGCGDAYLTDSTGVQLFGEFGRPPYTFQRITDDGEVIDIEDGFIPYELATLLDSTFVTATDSLGCSKEAMIRDPRQITTGPFIRSERFSVPCGADSIRFTLQKSPGDPLSEWERAPGDVVPFDTLVVGLWAYDSLIVNSPDESGNCVTKIYYFDRPQLDNPALAVRSSADNCEDGERLTIGPLPAAYANTWFAVTWTLPDGSRIEQTTRSIHPTQTGLYRARVENICGDTASFSYFIDELFCSNVSGLVTLSPSGDCSSDLDVVPAPRTLVELVRVPDGARFFTLTDDFGNYSTSVPAGNYRLFPVPTAGSPMAACDTNSVVSLGGIDNTVINLRLAATSSCAAPVTSIVMPRLVRCFGTELRVRVENRGTQVLENGTLRLALDPFFVDVSVVGFPFSRVGDTLFMEIGDLDIFGVVNVPVTFTVSCDAELGQGHCVTAAVSPAPICQAPEDWQGALVAVTGQYCEGDSVTFTITNVGDASMTVPLSYIVVEDGIMMRPGTRNTDALAPGEEMVITVSGLTGSTYQLISNQEPAAPVPTRPSAIVGGCGEEIMGDFANLFENGNGNPGEATVCRSNVGAYDPNEKIGYPLGYNDSHDIEPGSRLTYDLHFQNTGTDTAFTVVIRDTIPEELNLSSLKLGAGSHDYRASLDSNRVLTFFFDNILLPDSAANLAGSQGVVQFSIDHAPELERGDRFRNRAGIYFDFNAPIVTEWMNHRLSPEPLILDTEPDFAFDRELTLRPNPVSDWLTVAISGYTGAAGVVIYDGLGRLVLQREWSAGDRKVDVSGLRPGAYYLTVSTADGRLSRGQTFVVGR